MRIAAIDIGTNSIHMIVVRVSPDLSFEVIDREKEMVRLGAGGLDGRNHPLAHLLQFLGREANAVAGAHEGKQNLDFVGGAVGVGHGREHSASMAAPLKTARPAVTAVEDPARRGARRRAS